MHTKYAILIFLGFIGAGRYLYAEDLRNLNEMRFSCMHMQPEYIIKEDGSLGYISLFLARTGVLSNIVSLIHVLGNNLEEDGIKGFSALFWKLGVEREEGSSKVCIGDFLVYDCKEKIFAHKHDSGRLFTDTIVEIVEECSRGFFQKSEQRLTGSNSARDGMTLQDTEDSLEGYFKAIDLADKLINSRYFLLHIYLYTTRIKSREDFRDLYDEIFSKMVERGDDLILDRCFVVRMDGERDKVSRFEPLFFLGEYWSSNLSTNGFGGCLPKVDDTMVYNWEEGFIYAFARRICRMSGIKERDFVNGGDKDIQEFLMHAIDIGYVSEFDSLFKKKCTRLFREKINKDGCFCVRYGEDLRIEGDFLNLLGMAGNFFIKLLEELGLESKPIYDLSPEYFELLRISGLAARNERDIVEGFMRLGTKMIRYIEEQMQSHIRRNRWCFNLYEDICFKIYFEVRVSKFDGRLVGRSILECDHLKFIMVCEERAQSKDLHTYLEIKASDYPYRDDFRVILSGIPILDIFAERYRRMVLRDLWETTPQDYYCSIPWRFEGNPIGVLMNGDLETQKQVGYLILDCIFRYLKSSQSVQNVEEVRMKRYRIVNYRIVEMILSSFNTNECSGSCMKFLRNIRRLVGGI